MQNSYHLKYQNCRQNRRQSMDTMASTSSDIITDDDTIGKNTIPKMELLQINYVNKNARSVRNVSPQQQQQIDAAKMRSIIAFKKQVSSGTTSTSQSEQPRKITTKSLTRNQNGVSFQHTKNCNPLKYAVYKKHNNSIEKLQYINDGVKDQSTSMLANKNRKKLFGDTTEKKKTKFENIQFYFDSKGYEQHVDNKIYGCIEGDSSRASTPDEASKSNSWSFRKVPAKSPSQPPPLPPANRSNKPAVQIDAKIVPLIQKFNAKAPIPPKPTSDMSRIRQLFPVAALRPLTVDSPSKLDETAGSLKKVKKLLDNFENRCSCSDIKPTPPKVVAKTKRRLTSNDRMNNHPKREQRIAVTNENIAQIFGTDRQKTIIESDEKPSIDVKHPPLSISHQISKALMLQQNTMKQKSTESSRNTCGYKKCTFINCPMSSSSSSSDDNYCTAQDIHSTKTIEEAHDYHKTSEANEKSPVKDPKNSDYIKDIDSIETVNNLRNLQSKLQTSAVIPELKFTKNNQNFNDSIKCKQITKVDFNSKNIETKQLNNIVALMDAASLHAPAKNQQNNCVKIFISNVAPSIKSISSDSSDLGYYEKMPSSDASSSGCNSSVFDRLSPSTSTVACRSLDSPSLGHKLSGLFPSKLGCDGAIFWNDCYYYDEHACCSCQASSNGDLVKKTGKFICVCDVDQVRLLFIFYIAKMGFLFGYYLAKQRICP